jgi:4-alpha-glucanotransferase
MGSVAGSMKFPRSSGILLHPTSLPGGHGSGDVGAQALAFADFLADAKQTLWQVLPLGPTGYGDSPYQCFSAFAGNPLLIALDPLVEAGWLDRKDLAAPPPNAASLDYQAALTFKLPLLTKAAAAFHGNATTSDRTEYEEFCSREAAWLNDFALFMAAKDAHGGIAWPQWEPELRARNPEALARWREQLRDGIRSQNFVQWIFFRQFDALRTACQARGIRLMGDIPIYASADSSDVWCHRDLFELQESGDPALISGVPPDYFSATGQLWGNPTYNWAAMEKDGYRWWIERFRATFRMFDAVRVDHFRGFQAYWQVRFGETTAVHGAWVEGPGGKVFEAVERELGDLAILAENLGVITPQVEAIRHRFGFPGMAVLQFAFGTDPQGPSFRPHNYPRDVVAYTGTHDNDTAIGWWTSTGEGDSTRTHQQIEAERRFALNYLGADGSEINWSFIRALMASVADTVIFPAQDLLGLGSEARMNLPASLGGNWRWRLTANQLTPAIAARLRNLAAAFDR